eukprot:11159703-Lingulodinium_polyedra.AAC.1
MAGMAGAHPGGTRTRTAGSSLPVAESRAMVSHALATARNLRPTSSSTAAGESSPRVHATQ